MDAVTFVMTQEDGFRPINLAAEERPFSQGRIHQFNVLEDGTLVVLREISGDLDYARDTIENVPSTVNYSVLGGTEGDGLAYVQAEPPDSITRIIELPSQHEVVLDYPLKGISETKILVRMISESRTVLQDALGDVPKDLTVDIKRIGSYPLDSQDISTVLTERQQEILDLAVEMGYYDVPRQATHADIAKRLSVSVSTISEHMQKIEARVFDNFAG